MLGAAFVTGFDVDDDALAVFRDNAEGLKVKMTPFNTREYAINTGVICISTGYIRYLWMTPGLGPDVQKC